MSIVKFFILFIPYSIAMMIYAPSLKWKFTFVLAGAVGIWIALAGKTLKGVTPIGRRF